MFKCAVLSAAAWATSSCARRTAARSGMSSAGPSNVSLTMRLATSPLAWPPIPSATKYRPLASFQPMESSFCPPRRPGCVRAAKRMVVCSERALRVGRGARELLRTECGVVLHGVIEGIQRSLLLVPVAERIAQAFQPENDLLRGGVVASLVGRTVLDQRLAHGTHLRGRELAARQRVALLDPVEQCLRGGCHAGAIALAGANQAVRQTHQVVQRRRLERLGHGLQDDQVLGLQPQRAGLDTG